jgi:hypothetical protein
MDRIKDLIGQPRIALGAGLIIGLIIGLPLLGWWIWPVQYFDAEPQHLREDLQVDYLQMVIDSYSVNGDQELATKRWELLGNDAEKTLKSVQEAPDINVENVANFSLFVDSPPSLESEEAENENAEKPTAVASGEDEKPMINMGTIGLIFGVSCVLLLVIGGALAYVLMGRKGGQLGGLRRSTESASLDHQPVEPVDEFSGGDPSIPVATYMTTYSMGDDLYDDSFSIDATSGEFLGECGVGISDTLGGEDPKKVSAFEVWLFDKNDAQTVTKVLMSDNAFNDTGIRQRLEPKGEPIQVEPGKLIALETTSLRLEARVVDANYGQDTGYPESSFMDRITLELAIWQKPG